MLSPVFLPHGSPYTIFEQSEFTRFLYEFGRTYQPRAIVIFSAHFEAEVTTIAATDDVHEIVYDYYGFPDEFYQVQYPARGSTIVASIVEERLRRNDLPFERKYRGLDHGVFPILRHAYPEANIPIVPVSVNPFLPARQQIAIGQALQGLEKEGILVIGSGFITHNFREIDMSREATPREWAVQFKDWIAEKSLARDIEAMARYETLAPYANLAVPRAEHFVPILIALGAGTPGTDTEVLHDSIVHGTMCNLAIKF